MRGYNHAINRLPPAGTFAGTIIDDMREGGYVAREVDSILLGAKTGPYSGSDAMVIADSTSRITTFLDLTNTAKRTMLSTALRVGAYLWETNKHAIESGKEFFLVGTNMGVLPAPRMIQTMSNPHFHTTLFPQYAHGVGTELRQLTRTDLGDHLDDGKGDKSATSIIDTIDQDDETHQRLFCIRPNNFMFRDEFMKLHQGWYRTNLFTLDTPLKDQTDPFTAEENMTQFHTAYTQANTYIRSVTIAGNPDNRGFGLSIVYDTQDHQWKLRLALMEKKDSQDNGSICESSGHTIVRKVVEDTDRVLDTRPFVSSMASAIWSENSPIH